MLFVHMYKAGASQQRSEIWHFATRFKNFGMECGNKNGWGHAFFFGKFVNYFPKAVFQPDACTLSIQAQTPGLAFISVGILACKYLAHNTHFPDGIGRL